MEPGQVKVYNNVIEVDTQLKGPVVSQGDSDAGTLAWGKLAKGVTITSRGVVIRDDNGTGVFFQPQAPSSTSSRFYAHLSH